jgi:glycosyltransferase involved in cell wall biosynthesis
MNDSGGGDGSRPYTLVVPLPPSYRGGTEEYAYRLAQGLAGVRPTRVVTTDVRWDPRSSSVDFGAATVERLHAREMFERPVMTSPSARGQLRRRILESGAVNLHMPFPLVESPAARLAQRRGIPLVLTYHMDAELGSALRVPGSGAVTALYRRFSAHPALARSAAVVANSRGYAEASPVLSRHLDRVTVIRKGVDPVRLGLTGPSRGRPRPPFLAEDPALDAATRLLFVGRLVPYKGVDVLLRVFQQLRQSGREVYLMIAGKGPLRADLETQARRLGIADRVRFLGFVGDGELGDLYRYADITVVPSLGLLESSATALEEAAACGCPVVGSDLPGAAESIPNDGRRGLLVPAGDEGAIAAAIERIAAQPRPPLPGKVRTWNDVVDDYRALFARLGT